MSQWSKGHCKRRHPLTAENIYVNPSDGRRRCRACIKEAHRRTYPYRRAELAVKQKSYKHDHAKIAARTKAYKTRNPEKTAAHAAVEYAVRVGKLVRPEFCQCCGEACRPHAHHPDYEQQLVVEWLCAQCHRNVHMGSTVTA